MVTESYLKYLLSDDTALQTYYLKRENVSLQDIGRHLMLSERANNTKVPDHYYRLGLAKTMQGVDLKSKLFTVGLARLADNYLEIRNDRVYVKAVRQNHWQLLLPQIPPMLLVATKVWMSNGYDEQDEYGFVSRCLKPSLEFTTLPSPDIPQMSEYLYNGGLNDLHVHLNGALESDLTWQDFLHNPLEVRHELEEAFDNEKVMEQYEQSSMLSTPDKFYRLLRTASLLRWLLYCYAYNRRYDEMDNSLEALLGMVASDTMQDKYAHTHHPMAMHLGDGMADHLMEALMYVRLLHVMNQHPDNETVSTLVHYYLLILGLANKMMVQQTTSNGFEEFQKITLNGLREYSEKNYNRRFLQMSGNMLGHVRLLEGRFSPKDTQTKNKALLTTILKGWEELKKRQAALGIPVSELRLVAHFIKKTEGEKDDFIRFKARRSDILNRATLLVELLHENSSLSKAVVGIDAAASEFDTPPEVFAPAYHLLRKGGYAHFTYHAGEDFFHVLSGLRAVYEAVEYLGLERGDRIGHATATGVSVGLWQNNIGERMYIRKGEHLDNLIFAFHLISEMGGKDLRILLPMLSLRIDKLGSEIYGEYYPVSMHVEAWLMRGNDPAPFLSGQPLMTGGKKAEDLFLRYHQREVSDRYDEIIETDIYEILGEAELTLLQQMMLHYLHDKEIVIETLPTSNVVIGHHNDYSTYHLLNWYQWKKEGKPLPPIVVGTDDTGIFATNIYNEYSNIFCQMVYGKQMNADEVAAFIGELNHNARLYAFWEGEK